MAHVLDAGELTTQRLPGQHSKTFLAIPQFTTLYTCRLNGVPASFDRVAEISVDDEDGTLSDVLPDMVLYVGSGPSGPAAYDIGIVRIRKTPITGTFYIGETSDIVWVDNCYLTVKPDYGLWQRSIRMIGNETFVDWDVEYDDQHEDFTPVPAMGCHRVKKLTGATVDVVLGPAADTPAWVIGSTIASREWTCAGATFDDDTAVNPLATFSAAGTYLVYCEFTAANGKSFTGVRYVIIYDDENPLIENFQFSSGRGSFDGGGYSFDVTMFAGFDQIDLRKRSLVILVTEDYADLEAVTMPGQIEGAENIVCMGWISDIDTDRNSNFGEISFTVESAEYWFRQIRDYPVDLLLTVGSPLAWENMPLLNVDRACWHFLVWRSTATRIMDIQPTGDDRYQTRFQTARANLWERLLQVTQPTIFAAPHVDNLGRLFLSIDPQMVPLADRDWPVVMELIDADIQDGISWVRRDVQKLAMLFLSGIYVSDTGGASSFFSMSPGHSYSQNGDEESQDNYLVSDQASSNQMCGLFYGWRNNPLDNLQINFTHSMRALGLVPRQYFYFEIDAADDPRGIGYAGNLIPREVEFSQDPETGFIAYSVTFEPESFEGLAINGDIPTMEDIDFSYPDDGGKLLPLLSPLSLPFTYPDPTEENENRPVKIVIATTLGVLYTLNADDPDITKIKWQYMNNGLDANDRSQIAEFKVTPNGTMYIMTNGSSPTGWGKIMRCTALGGSWSTVYVPVPRIYNGTLHTPRLIGLGVNPTVSDEIAIVDSVGHTAFVGTFDEGRIFIGNTSFSSGQIIAPVSTSLQCGIGFVGGQWYVFYTRHNVAGNQTPPYMSRYLGTGAQNLVVDLTTGPGQGAGARHVQVAAGKIYAWVNGGSQDGYFIINPDLTFTFNAASINPQASQAMAIAPTGTHGMAANAAGPWTPNITTDSLATWSSVAGTVPIGSDVWCNCGDIFRWLFGGGSTGPRFTPDQGLTYVDLSGNLGVIAASRDIQFIKFIE